MILAIGDPTRARILQALRWESASAIRLSEHLGMTHGRVGHHLKVLESNGFIEVVEERPVRGLTERIYRATFDFISVDMDDPDFDEVRFFFHLCGHLSAHGLHPASIAKMRGLHSHPDEPGDERPSTQGGSEISQQEFATVDDPDGDVYGAGRSRVPHRSGG